ncbi:hypothetical protein MFLAVUS_003211, partial [Mucor flavus]
AVAVAVAVVGCGCVIRFCFKVEVDDHNIMAIRERSEGEGRVFDLTVPIVRGRKLEAESERVISPPKKEKIAR